MKDFSRSDRYRFIQLPSFSRFRPTEKPDAVQWGAGETEIAIGFSKGARVCRWTNRFG